MNPCPENNKDADKSVPSAYSLFCGVSILRPIRLVTMIKTLFWQIRGYLRLTQKASNPYCLCVTSVSINRCMKLPHDS